MFLYEFTGELYDSAVFDGHDKLIEILSFTQRIHKEPFYINNLTKVFLQPSYKREALCFGGLL